MQTLSAFMRKNGHRASGFFAVSFRRLLSFRVLYPRINVVTVNKLIGEEFYSRLSQNKQTARNDKYDWYLWQARIYGVNKTPKVCSKTGSRQHKDGPQWCRTSRRDGRKPSAAMASLFAFYPAGRSGVPSHAFQHVVCLPHGLVLSAFYVPPLRDELSRGELKCSVSGTGSFDFSSVDFNNSRKCCKT